MKVAFRLGDDVLHAVVHQQAGSLLTMLNVHDDEDTSVEAGKANLRDYGGRLIELIHTGERLVRFQLHGRQYVFDPNRIFSDAGITATLEKHSVYCPGAHAAIKAFAEEYIRRFALDREPVIIALHNTSDGTFSIENFLPAGEHRAASANVHINPKRDKFDFFYVTDPRFFEHLKSKDYNVTLQDNATVTDDGSLSVFFAQRGIPYINIEAHIFNLDNQIEMLREVREMLGKV